jgi:hypothetical protein
MARYGKNVHPEFDFAAWPAARHQSWLSFSNNRGLSLIVPPTK